MNELLEHIERLKSSCFGTPDLWEKLLKLAKRELDRRDETIVSLERELTNSQKEADASVATVTTLNSQLRTAQITIQTMREQCRCH